MYRGGDQSILALVPADIAAKHKWFYLHDHDCQVHLAGTMERQSGQNSRWPYSQCFIVSRSQTASSLHFLQTDVIGREEGSGT